LGVTDGATGHRGITVMNGAVRGMATGIDLGALDSIVQNVHAISNRVFGIRVSGRVAGCTAIANGVTGVEVQGIARNNVATSNANNGIFAVCPSVIAGNSARGNGASGISTFGAGCVLANNAGQ
jgi:hypothetical protein